MSNFGAQVFIKGTSFDVLNSMAPSYIIDIINTDSGSVSYSSPSSLGLYVREFSVGWDAPQNPPNISVSGNTVSWSNAQGWYLLVYAT